MALARFADGARDTKAKHSRWLSVPIPPAASWAQPAVDMLLRFGSCRSSCMKPCGRLLAVSEAAPGTRCDRRRARKKGPAPDPERGLHSVARRPRQAILRMRSTHLLE